jgi:peroxiredoxin
VEGCGYRDLQDQFDALGVTIVGASFDSPSENQGFKDEEGFEYELWSDLGRELALHYEAASSESQNNADRRTVVLDAQGRQLLRYDPGLNFGAHPAEVLEDCQTLFGD